MATIKDRIQELSLKEVTKKDDDWTGMDSAARRKRQNRLNQRAYRRRKAQQEQAVQSQPSNLPCTWEYQPDSLTSTQSSSLSLIHTHPSPSSDHSPGPSRPPLIPYLTSTSFRLTGPITFPLTPDHLITLVQYNVLRATLTNMSILSLLWTLPLECGNALEIPILPAPDTIPESLKPTELQKATKHELWIDLLPLGQMRDNMILLEGQYDYDELCADMVGGLFEGFNDLEHNGVLVWSDPWCTDGWEATEGFLKKWGRLLRGCGELIESTNRWRGLRGEDPLVVEL